MLYFSDENTWEPKGNLECETIIAEYEDGKKSATKPAKVRKKKRNKKAA